MCSESLSMQCPALPSVADLPEARFSQRLLLDDGGYANDALSGSRQLRHPDEQRRGVGDDFYRMAT